MPEQICLPNGVTLGSGASGAYTDIDEGVVTHNSDVDYIDLNGLYSEVTIDFENPSGTPPYSLIVGRAVVRNTCGGRIVVELMIFINGLPVTNAFHELLSGTAYIILEVGTSSSFSASDAASAQLRVKLYVNAPDPFPPTPTARVTASDMTFTYESETGNDEVGFSETVVFGETWTVAGDGADNTVSWEDTVVFSEAWTIARSEGGGGDDIVPGADNDPPARTDTSCRSCGTFAQVTESLIFYADGFAVPVTWNGVSTNATAISGAKLLPYVVAHRDRVWLYGDEPYVTGTVQTTEGVTTIQFSTAPPAGILSKSISISGVTFGTNEQCSAIVTIVNGVQATLSLAPNQSLGTANFIVFSGTAGATLQWSDENNHASWTDTEMAVGRLDGDIPTGIASVSGFLLLFKRTKTWRFDYGIDPSDINDRALVVSSETRGLVAHRCCVVVEGTAYCLDQFGSGAAWWITRGGALFPIEIGGDISDVTAQGEEYELDWSKSSCWFGVYEPNTNSIWWFCTRMGDNYPKVAFVYNRPSVEGGDEPGRWMIHEFDHPCIMGVTAVGRDGVMRAFVACADPDNEDSLYLAALSGSYGDMATSSQSGTVRRKISNTVLDLGLHTELHAGSLVEINGEKRTVESDDTVQVTFTSSWDLTVVENKPWKAGWKPIATFKSIFISPDPAFAKVTVSQVAILTTFSNDDCVARLGIESDGNTQWFPVLAGAQNNTAAFPNDTVMAFLNPGVSGYRISIQITLESPGGDQDYINSVDVLRHKRTDPTSGWPSEMP